MRIRPPGAGALVRAAGIALIGVGAAGLLAHAADTRPAAWAVWFAGAALVHDLLLVPAVLAVGAATTWIPGPYRRPVQAGLAIGGTVALVALPVVLGYGRRPDNPSVLPLDYGANLLLVLALVAAATGAASAATWWRRRRRKSRGRSPLR
ncbi:hypothetical protein [Actinomadura craniellae]|uniref:hypothetical protein n=1 Tax=Actinomadura craniellae TaxID=2231787 RepID=UPI0018F1C5B6|nr:hypothetical protein [Actinomadura craniellae]